jgi:hypothetical protein
LQAASAAESQQHPPQHSQLSAFRSP